MKSCSIILLVVSVMLIALFSHDVMLHSSQFNTDCLYHLALLDRVLDYALTGDTIGEVMVKHLVNTSVTPGLRELHVEAYRVLLDYYRFVNELESETPNLSLLYSIMSRLNTIVNYASRVKACSHDSSAASALAVRIELKIKNLEERLQRIYLQRAELEELFTIEPYKDKYNPGDVIKLVVPRNMPIVSTEVFVWPNMVRIAEYEPYVRNETHYEISVEIPGARLLSDYGVRSREVWLALYFRFQNNSYMLASLLRAEYGLPRVQLDAPITTRYRDNITVTMLSDGVFDATLYMNDVEVLNTTLQPGNNTVSVNCPPHCRIGHNVIKLCVDATDKTIQYCLARPIYVEPVYPRVKVLSDDISIAWLGYVRILIVNEDQVDVYVTMIDYTRRTFTVQGGGFLSIPVYSGILPVQVLDLRIKVEPLSEKYDAFSLSLSVYVVNIPVLLVLTLISIILIPLVSEHEKSFVVTFVSYWRKAQAIPRKLENLARDALLKPYEMGLGSRIAMLYYNLLKKLKLGLPRESETLREHYRQISHQIPEGLGKLLWRFLQLVERDLYSSKKPLYEEAEEAYYGVLSASSEE
ncbi:MAG: hypothetical protein QW081_01735 [Desulfurococcaceae archaeon]